MYILSYILLEVVLAGQYYLHFADEDKAQGCYVGAKLQKL